MIPTRFGVLSSTKPYIVTIYGALGGTGDSLANYALFYNKNGGPDTAFASSLDGGNWSTECAPQYTMYIHPNNTLRIGFKNLADTPAAYAFNIGEFDCPTNTNVYCGTGDVGSGGYYYGTVTGSVTIYITLYGDGGGLFVTC